MELWQAIVLGLVEGLTEYLPVSSTGHLLITQWLLGIPPGAAANAYAIVIQGGAIFAVVVLYRKRVEAMARGLIGRDAEGGRLAKHTVVAFLPAAVIGVLADDWIEGVLFGPWPVVAAWAVGGALLLWLAPRVRDAQGGGLDALTWQTALVIGFAQCVALWPGVSRSLATLLGGLAAGLALPAAVEFSFLLGLVTLGAATAYKALQAGDVILNEFGVTQLVVGFVVAWGSAVVSVRWMVAWLERRSLAIFGWWRLGVAAAVAAFLF